MKMEAVNDASGHSETVKPPQPSPKEIGREFVRQYYTMLSERPQDVFRFYSHESYFVHDTEQPVQGQQKIQKAIERLCFVDCKARIYTVSGTATMNSGLVIQVCGELTIRQNPGRRFLQTFILCPQTPKKYYVHNDVFQWLDKAFGDTISAGPGPSNDVSRSMEHMDDSSDIMTSLTNGHIYTSSTTSFSFPSLSSPKKSDDHDSTASADNIANDMKPRENSEDRTAVEKRMEDDAEDESSEENMQSELHSDVSLPATENAPKTWAKLVGENTQSLYVANVTTTTKMTSQSVPHSSVSDTSPVIVTSASNSSRNSSNTNSEIETNSSTNFGMSSGRNVGPANDCCHLYIGGISKNHFPENSAVVEKEVKTAFEKYGPVSIVNIPRRAIENPDRNVFAFITMKTPEGAKNAFKSARRDRNIALIPLKIDSLGFDGEATLSEQKTSSVNSRGTTFMIRGNSVQGGYRGGIGARATLGPARGGGMRVPYNRAFTNEPRQVQAHVQRY